MAKNYTQEQIVSLARLAAADYAAACTGPTIRGKNGEKEFRGMTAAGKAKALQISEEEAKNLGLKDETMPEVALRLGLSWSEAKDKLIDLATATFDEMSEHWQNVNIESAKGMIALLPSFGNGDPDCGAEVLKAELAVPDFNVQAKYAATLHDAWLKLPANSWALGGNLDRPFDKLDPEEKAKDVQQLMSLYTWLCSLDV